MKVEFCFDVVCPFAYMASQRIQRPAALCDQVQVEWVPVLLGGLYHLTKAPQGKHGSATQVYPVQKQLLLAKDLRLQAQRHGIVLNFPSNHPMKSLKAQRLLCFTEPSKRRQLADLLFKAYWAKGEDITQDATLLKCAKLVGVPWNGEEFDTSVKNTLEANTKSAVERGAFGVPAFFINHDKLVWGADRLHFVEYFAGNKAAKLTRYQLVPKAKKNLRFYMDFSSPWCFLGWTQLHTLVELTDHVEIVPILLGALFRDIGTPNMPMLALSEAKRSYMSKDMLYWMDWWGEYLKFPSFFPIRTVLPLRVAIVCPWTIDNVFRAAWQDNLNIGEEDVLREVLHDAGFDADMLIAKAKGDACKQILKKNTEDARERGVIGVPTYEVDEYILWGQDRIDIVADLLCGWTPQMKESRL
jgi:2-hydroxychromene-2-carboxylate isomerase